MCCESELFCLNSSWLSFFFPAGCVLEVLEADILWPRWVARIGVTRSTQAVCLVRFFYGLASLCLCVARACHRHLSRVHPYRVGVQSEQPGCSSPTYLPRVGTACKCSGVPPFKRRSPHRCGVAVGERACVRGEGIAVPTHGAPAIGGDHPGARAEPPTPTEQAEPAKPLQLPTGPSTSKLLKVQAMQRKHNNCPHRRGLSSRITSFVDRNGVCFLVS